MDVRDSVRADSFPYGHTPGHDRSFVGLHPTIAHPSHGLGGWGPHGLAMPPHAQFSAHNVGAQPVWSQVGYPVGHTPPWVYPGAEAAVASPQQPQPLVPEPSDAGPADSRAEVSMIAHKSEETERKRRGVKPVDRVLVTDPETGSPILIKSFRSKQSLEKREEVSKGKRVYKCPFCDHLFSCSSNLSRHKRVHTGEKP